MPHNDQQPRLDHNRRRNPLAAIFTAIAGAALLVAGFFFSLVILSVVAVVGLALWSYFWWKTRALRRQLCEQMEQMQGQAQRDPARDDTPTEGVIIEGEVIREDSAAHRQ